MDKTDESSHKWNSNLTFLVSMIGSAVGLGNIWRYPYVLYSNGGGTFLFVYLISILMVGISFLLLEYSVGFKFKKSVPKIFRSVKPRLEVVGWFVVLITFIVLTYYTCIIGWDLVYFILSFFKGWGTDTNHFFSQTLLQSTDSIAGLTNIVLPCLIPTLVVWFIVWFISNRDLNKGIGKANKILIPTLFIMMFAIVLYSLTLKGALLGLTTLFTPNWNEIFNPNIWIAAITQILFSLSIGAGITITYASYIHKKPKLTNDVFIVTCANCGFELLTAVGIFSILGFMSTTTGIDINNLVSEGTGLAFIVFPSVLNVMGPMAYIIGPIFFLCIFFAGITSAIAILEPLSAGFRERVGLSRKKVSLYLCLIGALISVVYTTGSGVYILAIVDKVLNQIATVFAIILEAIIFSWIFGIDKILSTLNDNSPIKIGKWWVMLIKYILPVLLSCLWINGVITTIKTANLMEEIVTVIVIASLILIPLIITSIPYKSKPTPN
ncbi:MAG: sodium-dependent transporter [Methanobrevibacter sp.]|jgi:NSS family neurotransmitter:Na+ symporter|nr:sodium-dependent transporter [Candidatus Methanovirga aequatorialis]